MDDVLMLSSLGNIEAFDISSFDVENEEYERLWVNDDVDFNPRYLFVDDGVVYAVRLSESEIIAVDISDGSTIDIFDFGFDIRVGDARDGVVYVSEQGRDNVIAYDVSDWSIKWETDVTIEGGIVELSTIPGSVFIGSSEGEIGRLNLENGAVDYVHDTSSNYILTIDSNLWAFEMES